MYLSLLSQDLSQRFICAFWLVGDYGAQHLGTARIGPGVIGPGGAGPGGVRPGDLSTDRKTHYYLLLKNASFSKGSLRQPHLIMCSF